MATPAQRRVAVGVAIALPKETPVTFNPLGRASRSGAGSRAGGSRDRSEKRTKSTIEISQIISERYSAYIEGIPDKLRDLMLLDYMITLPDHFDASSGLVLKPNAKYSRDKD